MPLEENKTTQDAEEKLHFIKYVIFVYNRKLSNVVEIIADKCSTKRAFGRMIEPILMDVTAISLIQLLRLFFMKRERLYTKQRV